MCFFTYLIKKHTKIYTETHTQYSQNVKSLYIIFKSVKGTDGAMPRKPEGGWTERETPWQTSDEFSEREKAFGDWRGLEDY